MHDIKLARAIALATRADPVGIGGPGTLRLAAVLEQVPERLIERLTAEELAKVMVAITRAHAGGRRAEAAAVLDEGAIWDPQHQTMRELGD